MSVVSKLTFSSFAASSVTTVGAEASGCAVASGTFGFAVHAVIKEARIRAAIIVFFIITIPFFILRGWNQKFLPLPEWDVPDEPE